MKNSVHTRMKENYEHRYRFYLPRRIPVIIRLDGKAFHTLTRHAEKPFDENFIDSMYGTAQDLLHGIQGCKCAYVQSDEISLLLTDLDTLETQAWFDYNLSKMVSISASIASVYFTQRYGQVGFFDSRAFSIPADEVANYFISRQIDWTRNSIQMLAQSLFSQKELHGKPCAKLLEMCHEKGSDWDAMPPERKYGTFITALETICGSLPDHREEIERFL